MVSQGSSSWMTYSQVCCFTHPNWLILQSDECQSWCKENHAGEEWVGQTGVWRGPRMEENRLSPPVAAASFWLSSSITKPLVTRERSDHSSVWTAESPPQLQGESFWSISWQAHCSRPPWWGPKENSKRGVSLGEKKGSSATKIPQQQLVW